MTIEYLVRGEEKKDLIFPYDEKDLMEKYRLLSPEGKEVISATIKLLISVERGKDKVG